MRYLKITECLIFCSTLSVFIIKIVQQLLVSDIFYGKGLFVTLITNRSNCFVGVQISILNITDRATGIQIGLWNRIGARASPFINIGY
jgi:hypothetical protein